MIDSQEITLEGIWNDEYDDWYSNGEEWIYHAVPPGKRPEAVYEVLVKREKDGAVLEALMQHGDEELPEFQEFLLCWIAFLGTKSGRDTGHFLLEAVDLLNDTSVASAFAKKYAAVHPGLYLSILENRNGADISDMVSLGRKAIKMIPKNYIVYSRAALKTAEYIVEAEKNRENSKNTYLMEKKYFLMSVFI